MQIDLSQDEAQFLSLQLARHLQHIESELAHTDKFELQHALAQDLERLRAISERLTKK
jgi:hypothetical protein